VPSSALRLAIGPLIVLGSSMRCTRAVDRLDVAKPPFVARATGRQLDKEPFAGVGVAEQPGGYPSAVNDPAFYPVNQSPVMKDGPDGLKGGSAPTGKVIGNTHHGLIRTEVVPTPARDVPDMDGIGHWGEWERCQNRASESAQRCRGRHVCHGRHRRCVHVRHG
jgi:hypothetical protein